MNILITSPRAPVALEWVNFAKHAGHQVTLCDSLQFPVSIFANDDYVKKHVTYVKVPAPRLDFIGYQHAMLDLIAQADKVIPTCEDIFYLAQLPLSDFQRQKCLMPDNALLFDLHDKFRFFDKMPTDSEVNFPKTRLIINIKDIVFDKDGQKTVLKPVFSRFGRSVVRGVMPASVQKLNSRDIRLSRAWVQQDFIAGQGLCNYAICEHGKVIAHSIYRPRYLLNQSASTYFDPVQDDRLDDFIQKFTQKNSYHGQVAFDFIDDGERLWLLECNPRATSGLHLLRDKLFLDNQGHIIPLQNGTSSAKALRVGASLPLLFGWQAIRQGKLDELITDYQRADDVISELPMHAQWLALGEMLYRRFRYYKPLTNASTFDIEYDGDE